jgi:hypothetical protein
MRGQTRVKRTVIVVNVPIALPSPNAATPHVYARLSHLDSRCMFCATSPTHRPRTLQWPLACPGRSWVTRRSPLMGNLLMPTIYSNQMMSEMQDDLLYLRRRAARSPGCPRTACTLLRQPDDKTDGDLRWDDGQGPTGMDAPPPSDGILRRGDGVAGLGAVWLARGLCLAWILSDSF